VCPEAITRATSCRRPGPSGDWRWVADRLTKRLPRSTFVCTPLQRLPTDAMIKTLTRHGDSLALVIEKPVLNLLEADAETRFEVTTDGQVLILSPIKDRSHAGAFQAALDKVNARYPKALKRLAE
jgi:antitoxin component of MazEF toxin-antitoxin module